MATATHPAKQDLRDYMAERSKSATPPPSLAEIRRILGWNLVQEACEVAREVSP